jgi:hypothetical protein
MNGTRNVCTGPVLNNDENIRKIYGNLILKNVLTKIIVK